MIGRSPDIEGTRSVAEIHYEDRFGAGDDGRSPDIEGMKCYREIHWNSGRKQRENNMTDNYNDDYREVILRRKKQRPM